MGRSPIAPEVFNCSRARHRQHGGARALRHRRSTRSGGCEPLLERRDPLGLRHDRARRSPPPTPPTSSRRIVRDGDHYVINGRKWWTSGAGDPRCKVLIFMGKTDPQNPRPPQAAVDDPGAARHAGHQGGAACCPSSATTTRPTATARCSSRTSGCPARNMLLGEGRGFEIAQGRLGPGRIHHCMRQIGVAERALELMCKRASQRVAFGKPLAEQTRDAGAHRRVAHRDRPGAAAGAARGAA